MGTRIIFNGQEYPSTDAMPEAVRTAYQQAIARFADADHDGLPDIAQGSGAKNVIGIQHSSITVNGKTYQSVEEMPALVRLLFQQAMSSVDANANGIPDAAEVQGAGTSASPGSAAPRAMPSPPPGNEAFLRTLDTTQGILGGVLQILLAGAAGAVLVGGLWMIEHMDQSSRSQGGALYVGLGMLVILGAIVSMFIGVMRRGK
jgi:hypothetical protein